MKPHFTAALEPMIDYLVSQNDYSSGLNDAESLRSKMSFVNHTVDSNFAFYENNLKPVDNKITPDKVERMKKFYWGNSIDQSKNEKLKLKSINLDYYGIKARSSSRQQKHNKRIDASK